MATALDHFVALKKESVYGTAVTVDRPYPFVDGTDSDWDVRWRMGQGIPGGVAGRRVTLGSRAFLPNGRGKVTTVIELESKGAGVVLDAALGVSTVTAITGGAQIVFHTQITNLVLPSVTIQIQKVQNDGTAFVETYRGCTASKVTIEQPEDDIPRLTVEWDALGVTTATAAITPSYPTTPTLFDASQVSCFYGGSFTAPTTTAAAALGTSNTAFRSFKVEIDQAINDDGWVLNGGVRSQPKAGVPDIKFSGKVEFNAATVPANFIAGTKAGFLGTWSTTEVLGAGVTQMQVAIPQVALTKGLASVKPGEAPTVFDVEGMVTNDGTNRDLYVVYRTTDTAL